MDVLVGGVEGSGAGNGASPDVEARRISYAKVGNQRRRVKSKDSRI